MDSKKNLTIMFPHRPGAGGPGSFQTRFEDQLKATGHTVLYKDDSKTPDLIFVVGGTKRLFWLFWMRLKRIPILYRLDGIAWLHKKQNVSTGHYLLAESRNWASKLIHGFLASQIVYQSKFVEAWWQEKAWRQRQKNSIIYNGVSLPEQAFVNKARQQRSTNRLVVLEGVIDYSPYAIRLLNDLAENLPQDIHIEVYGKFESEEQKNQLSSNINYKGYLQRDQVYEVMAGSVYLSLDILPACPNTVAEALACGAPVVAFDTGALPELVDASCGKVVPYGSNPWDLEYPDVKSLEQAIQDVFARYDEYSTNAYQKADNHFRLDAIFVQYYKAIQNCLKQNE